MYENRFQQVALVSIHNYWEERPGQTRFVYNNKKKYDKKKISLVLYNCIQSLFPAVYYLSRMHFS